MDSKPPFAGSKKPRLEGLLVIGGEGSLTGAMKLSELGVKVVGIPATIDNDVWGTEIAIGVDTALDTALETIDRIKDTASSHHRTHVIELMRRNCGYLALMSAIAGGAEAVLGRSRRGGQTLSHRVRRVRQLHPHLRVSPHGNRARPKGRGPHGLRSDTGLQARHGGSGSPSRGSAWGDGGLDGRAHRDAPFGGGNREATPLGSADVQDGGRPLRA